MQINNIKITLSLLFFMVIIVMTITIIDYNRSITQLSILYIHAQPNENNKEKGGDDQKKEKKIVDEIKSKTKQKIRMKKR